MFKRAISGIISLTLIMTALSVVQARDTYVIVTGSGKVITETRDVSGFQSVELRGVGTVVITQGEPESLTITADDNVVPLLTSEVVDGKLVLSVQEGYTFLGEVDITFAVTLPELKAVELNGAGKITAEKLTTDSLSAAIAGAGEIKLGGQAKDLTVNVSGAGNIEAENLAVETAQVTLAGAGNIKLNVTKTIDITLSGFGTINYRGTSEATQTVSGLGTINGKTVGVEIPDIKLPKINIPGGTIGEIKIPGVVIPPINIPGGVIPEINIPEITIPDIDIPEIEIPDIHIGG